MPLYFADEFRAVLMRLPPMSPYCYAAQPCMYVAYSVFVSPSVPVRDLWTDGRAKSEAADGRTGSNSVGRPSIRRTGDYA